MCFVGMGLLLCWVASELFDLTEKIEERCLNL